MKNILQTDEADLDIAIETNNKLRRTMKLHIINCESSRSRFCSILSIPDIKP